MYVLFNMFSMYMFVYDVYVKIKNNIIVVVFCGCKILNYLQKQNLA